MENDVPQVYLLGKTYLTNNETFYIRNDSIIHMAAGDRHTIITTESGRVYAFGDNNSGQLGLGHTNETEKVSCIKSLKFAKTGEKVILAACGRESSLVATNRGLLYAFGSNHHCQLGIESEELTIVDPYPVKIEHFCSKISWKQLSMGAEHTCVLTENGEVYVWGSNEDGQCGLARKYDIIKTPKQLKLEYSVSAISCGYYHTALISEDGRLFLFGNNSDRQLGRSIPDQHIGPLEVSLPDPIKAVACGNQHTVVLTEKGEVYTCGRGDRGQLGLGRGVSIAKYFEIIENLSEHLTAIAAGEAHTAIVNSHGNIYLLGDGKHGKLSFETHSNEFEPCFIGKFKEYNVLKVVCGGCQTVILAQKKSIENSTSSKTKHMKYVEMNEKLQPSFKSTTRRIENFEPLKPDLLDRSISLNNTTDDLTKSNNRFSPNPRLDRTNNFKKTQISDDEISSSEERMKPNDQYDFQTASSTNSGRTSSSISSVQNENSIINLKSTDDLENHSHSSLIKTLTKSYKINSNIDSRKKSITIESQSGFFSKIFGAKSSQKLSTTTKKNSRTCLIM